MNIQSLANLLKSTISSPTWDLIVIFILLAGGFFYGISSGKHRIAATILYTYAAFVISQVFPIERIIDLTKAEFYIIQIALFIIIFLILAFFLGTKKRRIGLIRTRGPLWQVFILSFIQFGLILHIILGFLPEAKVNTLSLVIRQIFAQPHTHFWWLITPIIILILIKQLDSKK